MRFQQNRSTAPSMCSVSQAKVEPRATCAPAKGLTFFEVNVCHTPYLLMQITAQGGMLDPRIEQNVRIENGVGTERDLISLGDLFMALLDVFDAADLPSL